MLMLMMMMTIESYFCCFFFFHCNSLNLLLCNFVAELNVFLAFPAVTRKFRVGKKTFFRTSARRDTLEYCQLSNIQAEVTSTIDHFLSHMGNCRHPRRLKGATNIIVLDNKNP